MAELPRRYERQDDYRLGRPIHVVWEVTLACNLKCTPCGSRAGHRRPAELSTAECLAVIRQLARLGVRQVSLIGGEAYLRTDWLELIRAIREQGMDCSIQSGARGLTAARVRAAADAGLQSCGISIDGLRQLHDELRGVPGSFDLAFAALNHLRDHSIRSSVSTQITAAVLPQLRELMHLIIDSGAVNWQLALTVAMGNAADRPELLLQPYQMLELLPLLADLHLEAQERGLMLHPSNNIGYFGPFEHRLRIVDESIGHWQGCAAGHTTIGLEADGTVKGCPSLPTDAYAGGNVRDMTIEDMLQISERLRFTRDRTIDDLWGRCRECYYADVCRGGCTWTSHVLFGRDGNNPYCHFRALTLAEQGLRERIVKVADAAGRPFDHGRFDLITEPLNGGDGPREIAFPPPRTFKPRDPTRREERIPPVLELCQGCEQYVLPGTVDCPHCGTDVAAAAARYRDATAEADAAMAELKLLLRN
jgi:Y-X(10)_GDL-associated radical SAM protein